MGRKERPRAELLPRGLLIPYYSLLFGLKTEMRATNQAPPGHLKPPRAQRQHAVDPVCMCSGNPPTPAPIFNQFKHLSGSRNRLLRQISRRTFYRDVCQEKKPLYK